MRLTVIVFVLLSVLLISCKSDTSTSPTEIVTKDKKGEVDTSDFDCIPNEAKGVKDLAPNRELYYNNKPVIITKHANCRMKCRLISKNEVHQIVKVGKENKRKSDPNPSNPNHCPSKAYEGCTTDGQVVRIIMAECDRNAKLVTVIDLENDYKCHCK